MQLTETAGKVLPSWHYTNAEKLAAFTGKNLLSETELGWMVFFIYERAYLSALFDNFSRFRSYWKCYQMICSALSKWDEILQEEAILSVADTIIYRGMKSCYAFLTVTMLLKQNVCWNRWTFFFLHKICFMIKSQIKICWVFNVKIHQNPSTWTVKWEYLLANFNSSKQNPLVFVSQHWIFLFPLPSEKCSHQLRPIFLLIYRQMLQLLPHFLPSLSKHLYFLKPETALQENFTTG